MLERIRQLRKRRVVLRRFEIETPLSISDCLIRLTGRHPPFGRAEHIARPHPFLGNFNATCISIITSMPYELAGHISRFGDRTRFSLRLSHVEKSAFGFATSFLDALVLTYVGYNFYSLVRTGFSGGWSQEEVALTSVCALAAVGVGFLFTKRPGRGRIRKLKTGAPEVGPTIQILANLVLATEVQEFPSASGTQPQSVPEMGR